MYNNICYKSQIRGFQDGILFHYANEGGAGSQTMDVAEAIIKGEVPERPNGAG